MKKTDIAYFAKIILTLGIITAVVAAMLAGINSITKDKIEENTKLAMNESIKEIFGDCTSEKLDGDYGKSVKAVYAVKVGGNDAGFCVYTFANGYGGAVEMMVGISPDGSVRGVSVVSHSETSNIGTKVVGNSEYLGQYAGKSGSSLELGKDIDAVSGATRSSKAVIAGVNNALALNLTGKNC